MEDRLNELWNKAKERFIDNTDHKEIIEMLDNDDKYEYWSLYDTILDEQDSEWVIVYATYGDGFQEYVYEDGSSVPEGEPVGIEKGDEFIMLDNVYYSSDCNDDGEKLCVFGCGKVLDPDQDFENSCRKCE